MRMAMMAMTTSPQAILHSEVENQEMSRANPAPGRLRIPGASVRIML